MQAKTLVAATLAAALATPATAGGIPVFDGVNLATAIQNTLYAIQQLQSLQQQYDQLITQYEKLEQQYNNMSGSYGMGGLHADIEAYGSQSWEDMLAILESGGNPGNAADVIAYGRAYGERYGFADGTAVYEHAGTAANAYHFDQRTHTTTAAMALSKAAYDAAGERMARLRDYLERIDNATSMKAAQDLQNRLLVELTQALLEANRLKAAMLQMVGADAAAESAAAQRNAELFDMGAPAAP